MRLSPADMEVMESVLPSLKEVCVTSARAVPIGALDSDAEEELEEVDSDENPIKIMKILRKSR